MTSEVSTGARVGAQAALGTLLGVLLSGPVAVALVDATHPQPPWQGAELFAQSYHPIQIAPYLGGIILVAALVALIAALHALAPPEQRAQTQAALVSTSVFATLILFNYVVQTTFVPELAREYEGSSAPIIAAFSMANPTSLAWGIEMWGWGFLGVATWLVAGVFDGSRLERAAALAFRANGPVSILGALWTVAEPGWVLTSAGLVAFALWNLLLLAMAALALAAFRTRRHRPVGLMTRGTSSARRTPRTAAPQL